MAYNHLDIILISRHIDSYVSTQKLEVNMSSAPDTSTPTWSNPNVCPFCGTELADPGAGFVDHLADSNGCKDGFELWRGNIADDIAGGWSG